jgi:hypothetical protein
MPSRFGLCADAFVRESPHNAVTYLWSAGSDSLSAVGLSTTSSAYIVPADATLLMMGFTDEIKDELKATEAAGFDRLIAPPVGHVDDRRLPKVAARKKTTDGNGVGLSIVVTVLAIQGEATTFGDEWTGFGVSFSPYTFSALRDDLPDFRNLRTV